MLNKVFIQQLKQSNISVDSEKSRDRLTEEWKAAGRAEQSAVLSSAGVARASIQRAYKTGNVSAKLVVALAQTLNISPFYLTGQSDERGECDSETVRELLRQHGYNKLLIAYAGTTGKRRKKSPGADGLFADADGGLGGELPQEMQAMADALTEEDMVLLLRSVLLRARAGGRYAELAGRIKLFLLT